MVDLSEGTSKLFIVIIGVFLVIFIYIFLFYPIMVGFSTPGAGIG